MSLFLLYSQSGNDEQQLQLQVSCAKALYHMKGQYADAAAQLVMSVLNTSEAHPAALQQYAAIAADQGLWADCVKVTLRLIVQQPHNNEVKRLLAASLEVCGAWLTCSCQPDHV